LPLAPGAEFDLPDAAAAHVKVRRLQPGAALRLFDGTSGLEWPAEVRAITRGAVQVRLAETAVAATAAELPVAVALAFGMPANERVDALVEKATELGVAALWPLMTERSVLRLDGERAERRRAHWQAVAAAACEQCGRARVPRVHAVQTLQTWLKARHGEAASAAADAGGGAEGATPAHWLLSTLADAPPLAMSGQWIGARPPSMWASMSALMSPSVSPSVSPPMPPSMPSSMAPTRVPAQVLVLSGPDGGFTPAETDAARAAGFTAVSLGPRILRADTAPLAVLAWLAIASAQRPEPKSGA
jgi:16S rRNA (uracil1498-N3)-methyltransferase